MTRDRRLSRPRRLIAVLLTVALLGGCASSPARQAQRAADGVVVTGHGWTAQTILGVVPAPGSCHYRHAGREVLPDPNCTPGAVDSAVSQANLRSTVCRRGGYTASVRPPVKLTAAIKRRLLAAYGIPAADSSRYELDHLIELSSGGSSDVRNLWPEPNLLYDSAGGGFVHNDKDQVEEELFHAQCAGKVSLRAIQAAVSQNWTTAVTTLGL